MRAYLAYLSCVFEAACKDWQWITHNPLDGVSKPEGSRKCVRYLTEDERPALLNETAKDPQLHTMVVLALATAARAGELLNLRWSDIEVEKDTGPTDDGKTREAAARLLFRQTKNAQPRTAWVHGEALRLLQEHRTRHPAGERVFVSVTGRRYDYSEPFDAACERAGIEDFTFHKLRHSAATYLAREGATEQQLRAIGGWKSNVVSRYVHLAAEDAKAVVQRMNKKILSESPK